MGPFIYISLEVPRRRYGLLELMLLFKASPQGTDQLSPIAAAIDKPDYRAIPTLLFFGASPAKLSLEKGDTPLHAAANIGLERKLGRLYGKASLVYYHSGEKYVEEQIPKFVQPKVLINPKYITMTKEIVPLVKVIL